MVPRNFTPMPVKAATTPRDGECYVDRWWVVIDGNLLLYQERSPQCNADRGFVEKMAGRLGGTAEHFDVVYLGWSDEATGRYWVWGRS